MLYFLDANVFVEAKNRYYRFQICPGFWRWLELEKGQGRVCSVKPIYDELTKPKDDLSDWVKLHTDSAWFLPVDDVATLGVFQSEVLPCVEAGIGHRYAKDRFLDGGDPWLIAKAKAHHGTVVTHEKLEPNSKKKVKIPNICRDLSVDYVDTFDVLEALGVSFHYDRP